MSVQIRPAKFRDLPELYATYFEVFPQTSGQGRMLPDPPGRKTTTLTLFHATAIHLFHVLLGRVGFAREQGSLRKLFQNRWDMKPFLIVKGDKTAGCCFLLKHNTRVLEIGIIGVLDVMRGKGVGAEAVEAIKRYAAEVGATRIVLRASGLRQATGFFIRCGFKKVYSETHLSLGLDDVR